MMGQVVEHYTALSGILFTLGFRQELLHLGIGAEFERALPGSDRFFGVIGGELRIT